MKIYFAGVSPAPEQTEQKLDKVRRLFSYFDCMSGGRNQNIILEKFKRMGKQL